MADPAPRTPAPRATVPPRWGLPQAFGGWLATYVVGAILGSAIVALCGYSLTDAADLPIWVVALTYPPLWLGFVGIPVWAAATRGNGWRIDFRGYARWIDVPIGAVAGLMAQYALVPLVALPALWLSGKTFDDLGETARDLADKAVGPGGALLFIVIVGIGAPIAEELFFRGLVLRSLENRFGAGWALAGSSLFFGLTHLNPLLFLPLSAAGAVFGALALKFDRLGPAITAHMAFNLSTAIALVYFS